MPRELREAGAVIKCPHCHDMGYTYLPIVDAQSRPDTANPMFGKSFPCLWCAKVRGELYEYSDKGQEQIQLMRGMGLEVP